MFVTHDSVPVPFFQILAHRFMPRLTHISAKPETTPLRAEAHGEGVALEDWDLLFGAVTERLQRSMDTLLAATADVPGAGPATAAARVGVLECVEALTQLRTTMRDVIDSQRP